MTKQVVSAWDTREALDWTRTAKFQEALCLVGSCGILVTMLQVSIWSRRKVKVTVLFELLINKHSIMGNNSFIDQ